MSVRTDPGDARFGCGSSRFGKRASPTSPPQKPPNLRSFRHPALVKGLWRLTKRLRPYLLHALHVPWFPGRSLGTRSLGGRPRIEDINRSSGTIVGQAFQPAIPMHSCQSHFVMDTYELRWLRDIALSILTRGCILRKLL